MADILEFLEEEDSSGVLRSVFDKSDISLASLTEADECPGRCWCSPTFVAYRDEYGATTASTLLQESRIGVLMAGRDGRRTES